MAQQQQVGKPKTTRLPLMGAYSNRGSSPDKDQRFVNMFPETRKVDQLENTKIFINKRPGLSPFIDFPSGEARAMAHFNNKFYVAIGSKVYASDNPSVELISMGTTSGKVGMQIANSSNLGDYLFICDGVGGWTIDTVGTITSIRSDGVYGIVMVTNGVGYGSAPTVTISSPGAGVTATATATVVNGSVTECVITDSGSGYVTEPTITISSPTTVFDPNITVTFVDDAIYLPGHTFGVGNTVMYFNGGGTDMTGLVSGTIYYTIKLSADRICLASSLANANNNIPIQITGLGTGTAHVLTGTSDASATISLNYFPSPHIPIPTFIDGYIVLAKGSDVYTSDLDNPHKWSAESFLSAEMFPDPIAGLARQNNQVVVFGTSSTEFFYDAANAAGSPLSRNDSTTIQMGTSMPYGLYQNEQLCIYISASESGGRAAWKIEGFQPKKISDEYIERILDAETDMENCYGYGLRTKGHLFYIINLKSSNRTLVYDIDEKLWHEWSVNVEGVHGLFPYNNMSDNSTGAAYLMHNTSGSLVILDPNATSDLGTGILGEIVTNKYDMDTLNRKFMSSLKIIGDSYQDGTNAITMQFSDNDYVTWSNQKTISLSDDFPAFHRLGSFRRRAFRLRHSDPNSFLRLESLEVVYTEGSS